MNESLAKAVLHSRLPDIASERRFAETLLSLDYPKGDEPHIWFVKLPGIRDVDAVIWQRRFGLFLVEIKSWPLSGIRALSLAHFELEPWVKHATAKSPWEQVTDACYQLLERFRSDNQLFRELGSPWLAPVVALFAIDRSSFLLRFQGESGTRSEDEFKNRISRGTIFAEDLATGDELLQRLGECRQYPIIGMAPKGNHRHVDVATATRLISAAIAPILLNTRQLNAYDQHRIRQLELELEERARDINWDIPAVITGHVGTGKTFLALRAARERLRVLSALNSSTPSICMFVCFNKVLATDISRLRDLSPSFRNLRFDCLDIFELVRFLSRRMDIDLAPSESDADDWVTHQVDRILAEEQPDFARMLQSWSLIIVDEAQDLKDWAWRLLDRLSGGGNSTIGHRRETAVALQ